MLLLLLQHACLGSQVCTALTHSLAAAASTHTSMGSVLLLRLLLLLLAELAQLAAPPG
jgi:hypothetical protein